ADTALLHAFHRGHKPVQGSVSIVGMTADGNFVAVAAVTVSAAG
ncbi:hypothetical protein M4Z77_25030, partial [Escherichia coli]|nr:hypothetical protein [Escherichia coli]